jgi:(p)ppGpp synthase/HD superfamily hydrolase
MIALRIIVGSKEECYQVLGIIHTLFKPKPGKFRDYISVPKRNGYQSLHTTVFGIQGVTTEFQIRTNKMHLDAEYGIAANYFVKDKESGKPHLEKDERANWASKIAQLQKDEQESLGQEFMENLKDDILHDRIFVFTPRGDSIDLPQEATCVDFAYEIHTEVGHRAIKAEVNGHIVPMTTKLHNNDTVNIVTSDIPKGPNRSWLAFIKTNSAKNKILAYFKKVSKEEKLNTGKRLLQKELDWAGLGLIKDIPQKKIKQFSDSRNCYKNLDEILLSIGEGTLSPLEFVNALYPQKDVPKSKFINFIERRFFKSQKKPYKMVSLKIVSRDAVGQLKKILIQLAENKLNALKTNAHISFWSGNFICKTIICVENFSQISKICESLEQIEGVKSVSRQFFIKKLFFILGSLLTFSVWAVHPYLLHYLTSDLMVGVNPLMASVMLYSGIFMLFLLVFLLKQLTQRSFPELRETSAFWALTFLLSTFAIITLFAEIYFFELTFNWVLVLGLIMLMFAYLTSEYIRYRE